MYRKLTLKYNVTFNNYERSVETALYRKINATAIEENLKVKVKAKRLVKSVTLRKTC